MVSLVGGGFYFLNKNIPANQQKNISPQEKSSNTSVQENLENAQLTTDESTEKMEQSILAQLTDMYPVDEWDFSPQKYIKNISVGKKLNGAYEVTVQTTGDALQNKAGHIQEARLIYKTLFQDTSLNIDKVTTFVIVTSTDKYGYSKNETYLTASLERSEAKKINWNADLGTIGLVLWDLTDCAGRGCTK